MDLNAYYAGPHRMVPMHGSGNGEWHFVYELEVNFCWPMSLIDPGSIGCVFI